MGTILRTVVNFYYLISFNNILLITTSNLFPRTLLATSLLLPRRLSSPMPVKVVLQRMPHMHSFRLGLLCSQLRWLCRAKQGDVAKRAYKAMERRIHPHVASPSSSLPTLVLPPSHGSSSSRNPKSPNIAFLTQFEALFI